MREPPIDTTLDSALKHHEAGDFDRAGELYRRVLEADPGHSDALHLLGVVAFQTGQTQIAMDLIGRAIAIKPAAGYFGNLGLVLGGQGKWTEAIAAYEQALARRPEFPQACNNLAGALRQAGRVDGAISAYRRAISLKPDFSEAHNNLGLILGERGQIQDAIECFKQAILHNPSYAEARNNLGNVLLRTGETAKAIACWREALSLNPNLPEAHNNIGNALIHEGDLDEAAIAFRRAIELQPSLPEAHANLGVVLFGRGQKVEAIRCYRQAVALRPEFADGHYNLSIALAASGDLRAAIESCRKAVAMRPHWPEALNNLGIWLAETGQTAEAIANFEQAIAVRPDYADARSNRGNTLRQGGRLNDAIESFNEAIDLRPDDAAIYNNLGNAFKQMGRVDEATAAFRKALELQPDMSQAHNNLGNLLKDQGNLDEAIARYQHAVALAPADAAADSNRIYTLYFHPGYDAAAILEEHRGWYNRHARALAGKIVPHDNAPFPRRQLRIGYISPDFRDHCQALFTLPLLSNHDRNQFEVHCYSDVAAPDVVTERLRGYAHVWRNIAGMSDERVAQMIRRDRIDILVDLTVHMAFNRLLVLAQKPAPVQVTWLGYPGTTGLETVDYRLSDPFLDPPGSDRYYSEKTIRLPNSFWCYDPMIADLAANDLPMQTNGFITFGCLNNFCKINDSTLRLWARVLGAAPGSHLLLLAPTGAAARENVLQVMGYAGIGADRIEFVGRQSRRRYLEYYHRIDIGLDTFPYNGHTTSLDSFWMGVPVVTRIGGTAVSRGGWSQASNLGLAHLAAESDEGFVQKAVSLAAGVSQLSQLRSSLRIRLENSPLMDGPRFARSIESAYREMWQQWSDRRKTPAEPKKKVEVTLHSPAHPRRMARKRMAT